MYFLFSTGGTPATIEVNLFATPVPNSIIHHYDGLFSLLCLCFIHLLLDQGPLLCLCLESMGKDHPNELSPTHGLPDREQLRLQRFICGIRILTTHCGPDGQKCTTPRLTLTMREGQSMTVADYFQRIQNKPLQFPDVIWAENCATCPRSNSCASRSPRGKPRTYLTLQCSFHSSFPRRNLPHLSAKSPLTVSRASRMA
ncbi:hypothetical protein B0H14DRAFT_2974502 [Mycena olivaceomarginata]|nr:hypothetical protein B0H14DRAFT_2974502 [Mycena olivaceomarginata]